jgi:hypothetical protein
MFCKRKSQFKVFYETMSFLKWFFDSTTVVFEKTYVPHLEKFCTPHIPHWELFVPHSGPYEMAALINSDSMTRED